MKNSILVYAVVILIVVAILSLFVWGMWTIAPNRFGVMVIALMGSTLLFAGPLWTAYLEREVRKWFPGKRKAL